MSKRPRRNHSPAFKAKVALEAIKGDSGMEKATFGKCRGEVFSKDKKSASGPDIKELHAKIGQLSMENDFLSNALGRIDGASAKR